MNNNVRKVSICRVIKGRMQYVRVLHKMAAYGQGFAQVGTSVFLSLAWP